MAADSSVAETDEECEVALEAAVGVALDHCTDEAELQRNIGRLLGVEPDGSCEEALDEGLNSETCGDFRGLRQWVMCRANQLLQNRNMAFQAAMEQAWSEAKESCDMDGSVI